MFFLILDAVYNVVKSCCWVVCCPVVLWAAKKSFDEEKRERYVEWVFRQGTEEAQPEVVRKQVYD